MNRQRTTLFIVVLLLILTTGLAAGWYLDHQRAQATQQRAQADQQLAQADRETAKDVQELMLTLDTYYFTDQPFTQRITLQIPHRGRTFRVMVEPLEGEPVAADVAQ